MQAVKPKTKQHILGGITVLHTSVAEYWITVEYIVVRHRYWWDCVDEQDIMIMQVTHMLVDFSVEADHLRGLDTTDGVSVYCIHKQYSFCELLFAFLHTNPLLKRDLFKKRKNLLALSFVFVFLHKLPLLKMGLL